MPCSGRFNLQIHLGLSSIVNEVKLNLPYLCRTEALPAVCVRCGRKAAWFRKVRLTSSEPTQPSTWGWILWELGVWSLQEKSFYEGVLHELKITKGRLKLPVCLWHRWIVPPFIGVTWVNDGTVAMSGASPGFVSEMKKRGWVR